MKQGDSWKCPHCGRDTFLKKESVMDGWKKVGEVLKCASCSAFVANCQPENAEDAQNTISAKQKSTLENLFGAIEKKEEKELLKKESSHFCRDCKYRVVNAFRVYCYKHQKDVNPMDDCPDFEQITQEIKSVKL